MGLRAVTPDDALRIVASAAKILQLHPSRHARERMRERAISASDLGCCGVSANRAVLQDGGTWKIFGLDSLDDEIQMIVAIDPRDDSVTVVTVF